MGELWWQYFIFALPARSKKKKKKKKTDERRTITGTLTYNEFKEIKY